MRWLDGIIDPMAMSPQTPGDSEGQGSLASCIPWTWKELDTTERLNNYKKEVTLTHSNNDKKTVSILETLI